ncbi:hypothetical protein [Singulisphaera sp. PoT]|uniref:hypothetical protein n=1 Tax=Singulisphaera sp. PoT TaxID=3411797 RepID=UPI003BF5F8C8
MAILFEYFLFIKLVFFYSIVRVLVKFDPMKDHVVFLGVIYTAGVAFLSFIVQSSYQHALNLGRWEMWLAETFVLSTFYFWLMAKYDEGVIFWTLLLLGIFVVLF